MSSVLNYLSNIIGVRSSQEAQEAKGAINRFLVTR